MHSQFTFYKVKVKYANKEFYACRRNKIMIFPAVVAQENVISDIYGYLEHIQGRFKRIYPDNILLIQLKGTLECLYDGRMFLLKEGDLVFLCSTRPVSFSCTDSYVLLVSIPSSNLMDHQEEIYCCSAFSDDKTAFSNILSLVGEALKIQYYADPFNELRLQSLWRQCLYELLHTFHRTDYTITKMKQTYRQETLKERRRLEFGEILDIIEKNYSEDLKLSELAELYFYTPSHLSKMFVKYTGMHFSEYLSELRLEKAMPLLLHSKLEIGAISDRTGFANPRSFQQVFYKKYGVHPSEYRSSFQETSPADSDADIRSNLKEAQKLGLFEIFSEDKDTAVKSAAPGQSSYLGSFDAGSLKPLEIAKQNCVLNIMNAKDLMLDNIQGFVREANEKTGFTYLNCHGFLSDDMIIYFEDELSLYSDDHSDGRTRGQKFVYNFSLYEKVMRFAEDQGLKFIIQLGFTPTFLAPAGQRKNRIRGEGIPCMPESLELWNDLIRQLFVYLYGVFGDWFLECPVLLWQVADVHVNDIKNIAKEDFFRLYESTWRTVKGLFPQMVFGSPTISCTPSGLDFEREFLEFCSVHGCIPDEINLVYIESRFSRSKINVQPLTCRNFAAETRKILKGLGLNEETPLHMLEYYYTFGTNPLCDSMAGAMLPLRIAVQNHYLFRRFGYFSLSDFTTQTAFRKYPFCGANGCIALNGEKKPIWYALNFLSMLGSECLGLGDGYIITKKNDSIVILLYYDVPESGQKEKFTQENALDFYGYYTDKVISLDITGLAGSKAAVRERFLNHENGSAYEQWLRSGGPLLSSFADNGNAAFDAGGRLRAGHLCPFADDTDTFGHAPEINVFEQEIKSGVFHYSCTLKPFEIRLVEICIAGRENE